MHHESASRERRWAWFLRGRARGLAALAVTCSAVHLARGAPAPARAAESVTAGIVKALERRGLEVDPRSVHWVDEHHRGLADYVFGTPVALVARKRNEPSDIFVLHAQLSPEGRLLAIRRLRDLTLTSIASESHLVGVGHRLAWLVHDGPGLNVEIADLNGERLPEEWSPRQRLQTWIANYQATGRVSGIARRTIRLSPPATRARVALDPHEIVVDTGAYEVRWPFSELLPTSSQKRVEAIAYPLAKPGNLVTWMVDRMRASPWFGTNRTQWLKAVFYDAYDRWLRLRTRVASDEADEIAEELEGVLTPDSSSEPAPAGAGFPPPPLSTILKPPIEREGVWAAAHSDVVALRNPGAPYPFVFTFLRTDPERAYSQISITLWDPRQVSLHVVAGTQEPKSATGELGTGMIPRDPKVLGRVVGAFNGAFQAVHGEFGMMERDAVVLPPKPFAATVAEFRDGSAGFGTWPDSPEIPADILSLRQNMTPLVLDGVVNPYRRHWWGGLPDGWTEESRTVRSGLCLTREGFVAYFYGNHADPKQLARAMLQTRCSYGIHLDMNAGHTGFEFYRVERSTRPLVSRSLDEHWEAAGPVPSLSGWQFFTRLMVRKMPLMNFPRYLSRVSRDFFYLTMRPTLPPPTVQPLLTGAHPSDGTWTSEGIAQHGWPPALTETALHLDPDDESVRARVRLLDPTRLEPSTEPDDRTVAVVEHPRSAGTRGLWLIRGRGVIQEGPPADGTLLSYGDSKDAITEARGAAGITEAGMIAEVVLENQNDPARSVLLLDRVLERLGCTSRVYFESDIALEPTSSRGADAGAPRTDDTAAHRLFLRRIVSTGAHRIFEDTPVLPPEQWAVAQRRKVTYSGRHAKMPTDPALVQVGDETAIE